MVKVTIENDKNKDEITGEFFMGLMLTSLDKGTQPFVVCDG